MRLRFESTPGMPTYHDGMTNIWREGDVQEVPDGEAERRLSDFPENFFKADDGPSENKMDPGPDENKSGNPEDGSSEDSSDEEGTGDDESEDEDSDEEPVAPEVKAAYTRALSKLEDGKEVADLTDKEREAFELLHPKEGE